MSKKVLRFFLFSFALGISFLTSCQDDRLNRQALEDDEKIREYLKKNNINATKDNSGFYYVFDETNDSGEPAVIYKTAYIQYIGRFLDDKIFDQFPKEDYDPTVDLYYFRFRIGNNEVISGLDNAVRLMKRGERMRVFIPSHLAYGSGGTGSIPGNTPIQFEVYLSKIE